MDAVTEILLERSQQAERLSRMVVLSMIAHGALITALAFAPGMRRTPADNAPVMTISLAGGAPGPDQGRTPMSNVPVQQVAPDAAKITPTPPPLAKPEMVIPEKTAKPEPKSTVKPDPKQETQQLHGRKPTQGAEVRPGDAKVETRGAAIPFGGLGTRSGGASGSATTDYADFCCPEYLRTVTDLIRRNWNQKQGQDGLSVIKFTIRRDGTIADVVPEEGSNQLLNLASQRAVLITQRVPPLPAAFTPPQLVVHLGFQYQR